MELVQESLDGVKAINITTLNLVGKTNFADYMVIATGTSQRHVNTMANRVAKDLKKIGMLNISIEGSSKGNWVLIDGGDIIVNLFRAEFRALYDLERLWGSSMPKPDKVA